MEIKETREISPYRTLPKVSATSGERFYETQEPGQQQTPWRDLLSWFTPEGWVDAVEAGLSPANSMRIIDLRFGPKHEGECIVSMMPGGGGGLDANINRWRKQMGLPDYTPEELAALPKKQLFNREATYVVMDGDYTNVGSPEAQKGWRLLGLIQAAPEMTLFVKLTGPKDLVTANEAAFEQFYQSIGIKR